jgi:Ca2+-binding EF-hand superfamily protein
MTLTRLILSALLTLLLASTSLAQPPQGERGPQDTDGDGAISRAEFDAWSAEHFNQLDQNGDGLVTEDERPERGPRGRHGGGAFFIVKAADADEDGGVSAAEWQTFLAALEVDAEGAVSTESLAEMLPEPPEGRRPPRARGGEGDRGPAQFLSRALDADRDGTLELADFETLFANADTNGDGALTADELPERPPHGPRGRRGGPRGPRGSRF